MPGEGDPSTEVVFVGEGPGQNEDREGRPFVGRAGGLLVALLGAHRLAREDVFITNIVKCRPPGNRDPEPDEVAACAPYLQRQLEVLDPAVVVTLGRHSMGRFMPGARISQAHGTTAHRRSRDRRARCDGLRDVPPGGGAPARRPSSARATRTSARHPGRARRGARASRAAARRASSAGRSPRPQPTRDHRRAPARRRHDGPSRRRRDQRDQLTFF